MASDPSTYRFNSTTGRLAALKRGKGPRYVTAQTAVNKAITLSYQWLTGEGQAPKPTQILAARMVLTSLVPRTQVEAPRANPSLVRLADQLNKLSQSVPPTQELNPQPTTPTNTDITPHVESNGHT